MRELFTVEEVKDKKPLEEIQSFREFVQILVEIVRAKDIEPDIVSPSNLSLEAEEIAENMGEDLKEIHKIGDYFYVSTYRLMMRMNKEQLLYFLDCCNSKLEEPLSSQKIESFSGGKLEFERGKWHDYPHTSLKKLLSFEEKQKAEMLPWYLSYRKGDELDLARIFVTNEPENEEPYYFGVPQQHNWVLEKAPTWEVRIESNVELPVRDPKRGSSTIQFSMVEFFLLAHPRVTPGTVAVYDLNSRSISVEIEGKDRQLPYLIIPLSRFHSTKILDSTKIREEIERSFLN